MKSLKKLKNDIITYFKCKIDYRKKIKEFNKKLIPIQEKYKPLYNNVKNPNWKKEWRPIVENDYNRVNSDILNVLLYKLEKMKLFLSMFSTSDEERTNNILDSLTETIELGYLIKNDDFNKESSEFLDKHLLHHIEVKKIDEAKYKYHLQNPDELYLYDTIGDPIFVTEPRVSSILDMLGGTDEVKEFLKNNGLKEFKDVMLSYCPSWDMDENETAYKMMLDEEEYQKKETLKKFFLSIAEHYGEWWD